MTLPGPSFNVQDRMEERPSDFYQSHLDRVSRSFAFCIRQLPSPLREWIGLSYLLCRIVDTIEDSAWMEAGDQFSAFEIFDSNLMARERAGELDQWASRFPPGLPEGESLLLRDSRRLLADFHKLPPPVHEVIRELVLSMSQGMQHFCRQRQGGPLRLKSLNEVNQYCFFVAGVVGEILAKLVARVEPKFDLSQVNLLRAHHFGLFLQKVNLLKDQVKDETEGRHLIPSREIVEDSSQENAAQALDFLLQVPRGQREFRRFCAWSLFLGIEALGVARDSVLRRTVLKVPRVEMQSLLERVEVALEDDGALRSLYNDLTARLGWPKLQLRGLSGQELPHWLTGLYHGLLSTQSLLTLGMAREQN